MENVSQMAAALPEGLIGVLLELVRWTVPLLAAVLLCKCLRGLLKFRREQEIWAELRFRNGKTLPVTHWENVIGRSRSCDLVLENNAVSNNHAVLMRDDLGHWQIQDIGSKNGVFVNGEPVSCQDLQPGDCIDIGGVEMELYPAPPEVLQKIEHQRTRVSAWTSLSNLMLLLLVQMLVMMGYVLALEPERTADVLLGFGGLMVLEWSLFLLYLILKRTAFDLECLAFFLCTMGMSVICSTGSREAGKQLAAALLGVVLFLAVGVSLRNLTRAKKIRYVAAVVGIGLLIVTLLFGRKIYGAKNWLFIGGHSFQPSELSKVCFVFVGASSLDRIMNKKNLTLFIVYSAMLCGLLAMMNDFGTALIFFIAFLAIAYMRSGSVGTVALAIGSLVFAGVLVLQIAPHALRRFEIFGHVWEDPLNKGYQQVRCLIGIASGGLLGLGAGKGWIKHMDACDTDVVFATLSEEWGVLLAVLMVVCILGIARFALRMSWTGRSTFYTIGACTAASILLAQTILNVLGTLDLLPFTGVTFPFVSNGGSSMMGAWGLLAFIKAADTRQNASFAIRLNRKREVKR